MRRLSGSAFLLAVCLGCGGSEQPASKEAGWSAIPNAYARHFELQVRGADRRIVVYGPGGMVDTVGIYVLAGRAHGREMQVDTPLTRVAVVSTTHLPFFTALGVPDAVAGVAHMDQVRDPIIRQRIAVGKVVEISRADGLDRERLLSLAPQALFDYPFGRGEQKPGAFEKGIAVTEYLEEHPLGRAEWVRFFAMLLGAQNKGDSLFNAIAHRYEFVRDLRGHLDESPKVLFGSHWEQAWFAPPGNSYMATLIADAGGRYWFADSVATGNLPMALEEVLVAGRGCRHFGVLLAADRKVDPLDMVGGDPRIAALTAVRKGGFIGNSARSDLFGQALLEPEVVLQDLRCIFHPRACGGHKAKYFFPVAQ